MQLKHVGYSELRKRLAFYMDKVCDDRAPMLITRQSGRDVVLMSEQEYCGLLETAHLLKSPANAERLLRSIQQSRTGQR